ncbi:MAG: aryl-sulfate sulfotransferase N-terminal domain-containing protein [Oscillospiraceae bacterium]|jgi:arylsulfate sulfotransferase|nr:aryl-sulfate sulfotransferase N-terminal domain-containing protein [Oscillospiraceae bacterium]
MIRLEMTKKQEIIIAIIILIASLGFFAIYTGMFTRPEPPPPPPPPEPVPPTLFEIMEERIEIQNDIDKELLKISESGLYSLENPYIKVDPYGTSPLTAIILFDTDEPAKVSIVISGSKEETTVSFTFNGFNTRHIIPVYGLYAGVRNTIELTAESQDGDVESAMFILWANGLPGELHVNTIPPRDFDDAIEPVFFFTHSHVSAFDIEGKFRWFYHNYWVQRPIYYTDSGNFIITEGVFAEDNKLRLEINMLGKIVKIEHLQEDIIEEDEEDNDEKDNEEDEEDDFVFPDGSSISRIEIRPLYTSAANDLGIGKTVRVPTPAPAD